MPEGDSLVRLSHHLRPIMKAQTLLHTDFRTPRLATVDLTGWYVQNLRPRAKYLLMDLRSPEESLSHPQQLVLLSHLGMNGSWQIDGRTSHRTRCILKLPNHSVLGHNLPTLKLGTPHQVDQQLAFLGPDLLDPGWEDRSTADTLLSTALTNFRHGPDQPIGSALLDQRLVSGIGNIYRCEVLSIAGISPYRHISGLTDQQLVGLILLSRDLLVLNIPPRANQHTARTTVSLRAAPQAPFGVRVLTAQEQARAQADGTHRLTRSTRYWVYGRQRHGCLRCGGPVHQDQLGNSSDSERTVFWCPFCQT